MCVYVHVCVCACVCVHVCACVHVYVNVARPHYREKRWCRKARLADRERREGGSGNRKSKKSGGGEKKEMRKSALTFAEDGDGLLLVIDAHVVLGRGVPGTLQQLVVA